MTDPYIEKILNADVYDVAAQTPLTLAPSLSERMGCDVRLKREDLQSIFSFKCRGAYNKMASLSDEERARGVVAASAGNHAQGVALAAQKLGVQATIVMPVTTPSIKVEAVRRRGAHVVLQGDAFDHIGFRDAQEKCIFPLGTQKGQDDVIFVIGDPSNVVLMDSLRDAFTHFQFHVCEKKVINEAIVKYFPLTSQLPNLKEL